MLRARDIMTANPLTVSEDIGVQEVEDLLLRTHHHGLPVVDSEGRLVGLVTDSDLVDRTKRIHLPTVLTILDSYIPITGFRQYTEDLRKATAATVGDLCTRAVDWVGPDTELNEIATLLSEHHIHTVPVVDEDGRVVGIISNTDIIQYLSQRSGE